MYLSIIPLHHSLDVTPLIYSCPQELESSIIRWILVQVPLGKTQEIWIITGINLQISEISYEIKDIECIITSIPVLPSYILDCIPCISHYYIVPIHRILQLFLPKSIFSYLAKNNFTDIQNSSTHLEKPSEKYLYHYRSTWVSHQDIISHIHDSGTIIIFPDDFFLNHFIETCWISKESYNVFSTEMTPTKKRKLYIEMYHGKKKIILWTRRVLYYNLSNYRRIIYVEDAFQKEAYQIPMRYSYLHLLEHFALFWSFDIHILSSTPSIELFVKALQGNFQLKSIW